VLRVDGLGTVDDVAGRISAALHDALGR
jgi:hypothetical protein